MIEKNLVTLEKFISLSPLVDFEPTGELDAMIATVVRSQNFILVTDNLKHFQNIANLQTENWLIN